MPLPVATATKPPFVNRGEVELFHGSPSAAVPLLSADPSPRASWLVGAALGALGRYGEARDVLTGQLNGPYGSLAASTLASHYRQLGRHDEAPRWDERALETASDDDSVFDARLGLAADAVGAGDLPAARTRLAAVTAAGGDWRRLVRIGWVETEVALLAGDPDAAVRAAEAGLATAEEAAAPRHIAKCLLFLGVSQRVAAGMSERMRLASAEATLRRAATAAELVRTTPLTWVIEYVLGQCVTDPADARTHARAAAAAVAAIGTGLPDPDKSRWFGRADIAGIVAVSL